jgi:hypothetical protein
VLGGVALAARASTIESAMRRLLGLDRDDGDVDLVADVDACFGCEMRRSATMRETCTRPSTPGASSTKAPNASTFRTLPRTRGASRKLLRHGGPRIGGQGAEREADPLPTGLGIGLDLDDLGLDRLADLHHLGRVLGAAVTELAHVDETFDAAEVDEGAEVADRSHGAGDRGADVRRSHVVSASAAASPRGAGGARRRCSAAALDLGDAKAEALPDVLGGIVGGGGRSATRDRRRAARRPARRSHPCSVR